MRLTRSILLFICSILFLVSCGQGDSASSGGSNQFSLCNKKAKNLADYGQCRCRQITGAKSYNQEMDDCMVNPKMYAEGYEGEIPQNILDKMK